MSDRLGASGSGLEPVGRAPVDDERSAGGPGGGPPSGPRRRHRRRGRGLRLALVALVLVLVAGTVFYEVSSHPFGGPGAPVTIEIRQGESTSAAIGALAAAGVVSNGTMYRLYDLLHGSPSLLPGYYTLPKNSTFGSVHAVLAAAPNTHALVLPSGFTLQEVANRLSETVGVSFSHHFAALLRSGALRSPFEPAGTSNLEGLVAPGTYLVTPTVTPEVLLRSMVARFVALAASVGLQPSSTKAGLDSYQLVTVASVVEKEGYYDENMPQVATVVYNRLARSMPLQMDSTVLYALGQDGGTVTPAMLKTQSPYNSYLHTGLPPTPICTPSRSALESTMDPPAGSWLYFTLVAKDGSMQFSDTFAEQLQAEALAASRGI
jgi:UPF0755 protein